MVRLLVLSRVGSRTDHPASIRIQPVRPRGT